MSQVRISRQHWQNLLDELDLARRQRHLLTYRALIERLQQRFDARHHRMDLAQAPLMRLVYAREPGTEQVVALLLFHHLILDNTAMEVVCRELHSVLFDQPADLQPPVPYRNYVAEVHLRDDEARHTRFFTQMLGSLDEPTLPFGLQDVHSEGRGIEEARAALGPDLAQRLREQARQAGVSAASLMHLAWARVLGVLANRSDVVFGTVLLGRMQGGEGADRALGVFINTLPLRIDTHASVRDAVKAVHASLTALLGHEHASLALAQRCSGVGGAAPLFSALLNYRHTADVPLRDGEGIWQGVRLLGGDVRSNYPLTLCVDDQGDGFDLQVLAVDGLGAGRVAEWMRTVLAHLVEALEQSPQAALDGIPILAPAQRQALLNDFNRTARHYPQGHTVQALIEAQARRRPDAPALVQGGEVLSYAELDQRANRLAHYLIKRGVALGDRSRHGLRIDPAAGA